MNPSTKNQSTTPLLLDYDDNPSAIDITNLALSDSPNNSISEGSCSSDTNMRPNIRGTRDKSDKDASILKKVSILLTSGTILGICMPKNEDLPTDYYRYISSILGYNYFLCWSISFYPQVILNHRRKSTVGLSTDFTILNVVGFLCYSIYSASLFWNDTAKEQYRQRYGETSTVQSNDVAFAFHALILSSITMAQVLYFRASNSSNCTDFKERSKDTTGVIAHISTMTKSFLATVLLVSVIFAVLVYSHAYNLEFLDYLYLLSSIKLAITTVKYIPQVLMNYNRKSTEGWNVWNVLLDFSGGTLSLLQLMLDCGDMGDWTGITGNWAKFGLGLVSIVFDVVFMLQHYVLYPNHRVISNMSTPSAVMDCQTDEDSLID